MYGFANFVVHFRFTDLGELNFSTVGKLMSSPQRLSQIVQPSQKRNAIELTEVDPKRTKLGIPIYNTSIEENLAYTPRPFYWKDYEIQGILGRGAFGTVYGLIHTNTRQPFALKLAPTADGQARIEAAILTKLSAVCTNLVRYYQSLFTERPGHDGLEFGILMEWVQGPNLREEITNQNLPNMRQFLNTTRQLLQQLACVHANDIVHRDIKPDNIVFDSKANQAKLVDFGIGCSTGQPNGVPVCQPELIGTLRYLAPELQIYVSRKAATPASDIWSLGATLYEWLFGRWLTRPSLKTTTAEHIAKVQNQVYVPEFLKAMIDLDPTKRPTAQQLLLSLK
jgi:serine/threonine protein kinase